MAPPRKYDVDFNYFSTPNLENSYWAGFIAADGCLFVDHGYRFYLGLSEEDVVHLDKFKNCVKYTGPIRVKKRKESRLEYKGSKNVVSLTINGVGEWHRTLFENYNLTPNKTTTLTPPNTLSDDLIISYIKGLFDGDGCVSNSGKYPMIMFYGTNSIVTWIKEYLESKLNIGTRNVCSNHSIFRYAVQGNRAETVMEYLKSIPTPILTRKWEKYENLKG